MLAIGKWRFDASSRRLSSELGERKLSPKAAIILTGLAESPQRVWSREQLLWLGWPSQDVGEEALTHVIAELRRMLDDDARAPRFIETIHKVGYRLLVHANPILDGRFEKPLADAKSAPPLGIYADYLYALELIEDGGRDNVRRGTDLLRVVVGICPTYAPAHAALAKALSYTQAYYSVCDTQLNEAVAHCTAARKLAPDDANALAAEGFVYSLAGDFEAGTRLFESAILADSYSASTHYLLGRALLSRFEWAMGATMLERSARLSPDDDYHGLLMAGKACLQVNQTARAKRAFTAALTRIRNRLSTRPNDFRALCAKVRCHWYLGSLDDARADIGVLASHSDPTNYHFACTLARIDEYERALDVIESIVELGWRRGDWLQHDRDFDGLRGMARFRRIQRDLTRSAQGGPCG